MKPSNRTRRSSQRGAAMVEAAFMFPMFIILWFASLYAYNWGRAQIDTKTLARQQAWATSMSNCGSPGQSESELLPPADSGGQPITHDLPSSLSSQLSGVLGGGGGGGGSFIVQLIQGLVNSVQSLFPNPQGAIQAQQKTINFRIPNQYAHDPGVGSKQIKANVTVYCNDTAKNGDNSIVDAVAGVIDGIIAVSSPHP
jgi:hypothetical protein